MIENIDLLNIRNKTGTKSVSNKLVNSEQGNFKQVLDKEIDIIKNSNKLKTPPSKVIDKRLMDVCVQMESLFVSKMLKTMRNTVPKSDFINGGFAEEVFEDMLFDEYALSLSKNTKLGIAAMLYEDLSKR